MVSGAVVWLFSSAGAQAVEKGACKADVQKLCGDVQPGEGRVLGCLMTHEKELSPKCASNVKSVKQAVKQVSEACEPDIEKFCFDTPIGKGSIASCLKKHSAELSPTCKDAVEKVKAAKKK
jgi:hypothetical protein